MYGDRFACCKLVKYEGGDAIIAHAADVEFKPGRIIRRAGKGIVPRREAWERDGGELASGIVHRLWQCDLHGGDIVGEFFDRRDFADKLLQRMRQRIIIIDDGERAVRPWFGTAGEDKAARRFISR